MQRRAALIGLAAAPLGLQAQAPADRALHAPWTALLRQHVRLLRGGQASQLDYRGLAAQRPALQAYLANLSAVSTAQFQGWPRDAQMAFWINAYNAFTAELILTRYPRLASIKELGSLLRSPWQRAWVPLLGATLSLDDIEHERLHPVFKDARIHFAVNCASVGCPMLREEAFEGERLQAQLDAQAERFLRDRSRNRVEGGVLRVSKIFDWFEGDFTPSLRTWLAQRASLLSEQPAEQAALAAERLPVRFLDYDWQLNDAR